MSRSERQGETEELSQIVGDEGDKTTNTPENQRTLVEERVKSNLQFSNVPIL